MATTRLVIASRPSADLFQAEADTLRAMAHPKRLLILSQLGIEGRSVTEIASAAGISLPNASQHLRVLRDRGIVHSERIGQLVKYRLTSSEFQACCARVRQVIARGMAPPLRPRVRVTPTDHRERPFGSGPTVVAPRPTHSAK